MELKELRAKIDRIDYEILKLLSNRMELALRTTKLKGEVADPAREDEVIAGAKKRSHGLLRPEFAERLYREVMGESRRLQARGMKLAGFQGEHGAYGDMAVRAYDPALVPVPCVEFGEVFEGVRNGQLDIGIVPVENSLEGAVTQVNDLLVETDLRIIGEVNVPIHHCLLAPQDVDYRDIKVVYSHPQALAQCRGFLARNKLEPRPYYDTAGAAMMLANERPKAAAAIAGKLCAELYGLEILKENVEDHESNSTRFLVLAREAGGGKAKAREKGDKCSLVFQTAHKAGALFSVLKCFSEAGVNLTRIESRPIRNDPGKYAFLLDFKGSDEDRKVAEMLEKVKKETVMFRLLGCYKEASR